MSMQLAKMEGHSQGVLNMSWCPHYDSLLLSCGKDNRTMLWDVTSLKPIADLQNENPTDAVTQGQVQKQLHWSCTRIPTLA